MMLSAVKLNSGVSAPIGSPGGVTTGRVMINEPQYIGSWNIRRLLQQGKLCQIEREMERCNIKILGLSETHQRDKGHFKTSGGNQIMCSGNGTNSRNGVAVIVDKRWSHSIIEYIAVNDRIIVVKLNSTPNKLNLIQVYAPTSAAEEEEIDEFYSILAEIVSHLPKSEVTIIQGDFNAKVGADCTETNITGKFGLGVRNKRGEKLIEFCQSTSMVITNTLFKHHPRRLYTWTSPNGEYKNQIDYCLIPSRWKSSIENIKTRPGADCGSDHQLLVTKLRIHLKNCKRPQHKTSQHINSKKEWERFETILQQT